MRVTVSVGPGAYNEALLCVLSERGVLGRTISYWPRFEIRDSESNTTHPRELQRQPAYDLVSRVVWAAWRRVPVWGRYETPKAWLFDLYDRLAAQRLGKPDLFVGWSQISLHSLRAAKRRGIATVLQHPMFHVDAWQRITRAEYAEQPGYFSLFSAPLVARMKREYAEAEHICVPSRSALRSFVDAGISERKLLHIPFGVDHERFAPASAQRDGPFRAIYVGRLELQKGLRYLLRAWRKLALPGAELLLCGPALPEIKPVLAEHRDPSIHVVGPVRPDELAERLRQSDVLVFPTLCDGFGMVILEAMASGLPVIATDHSGAPDVVADDCGFIVPPRDDRALAEKLGWLATHRDEARQMGLRARERIEEGFTLRHWGERLIGAYASVA